LRHGKPGSSRKTSSASGWTIASSPARRAICGWVGSAWHEAET
jgi:hypothetical protein